MQQKILIIDDDLTTRKLFKGILEKQGYNKIELSNSGEKALELIKQDPPDLILLDIFMPGIKGYEVCRSIKKDRTTSHIPVIMITGGAIEADEAIKQSFDAGATDFITKPIQSLEFLARIKSCLSVKKSHDLLKEELFRRQKAENENEKLIKDLKQALVEIRSLQGIVPICAQCKKIRDDKGYWNQLETYIEKHSDASFSHGVCPACSEELYGDEDWYIEMKANSSTGNNHG